MTIERVSTLVCCNAGTSHRQSTAGLALTVNSSPYSLCLTANTQRSTAWVLSAVYTWEHYPGWLLVRLIATFD